MRAHLGVSSLLLVSDSTGQKGIRVSGLTGVGRACEVLKETCVFLATYAAVEMGAGPFVVT